METTLKAQVYWIKGRIKSQIDLVAFFLSRSFTIRREREREKTGMAFVTNENQTTGQPSPGNDSEGFGGTNRKMR